MGLRRVIPTVFAILIIEGAMMIIVPIVDIITGYVPSYPFTLMSLILLFTGYVIVRAGYGGEISPFEALVVASIVWLLMPLLSAFVMYLDFGMNIYDAFFESVSGFTGTGFTVIPDVTVLRPSILLWRSMMQWIGELGVVVLAVIILPQYNIMTRVYLVERGKLTPTVITTAKMVAGIYFLLTGVGFLLYMLGGMTPFEAINLIMTTIATGGMSVYNDSVASIVARTPPVILPILLFMILGAQNFGDLRYLVTFRLGTLFKSGEFKAYMLLLALFSGSLILSLHLVDGMSLSSSIVNGIFHMVSGSTTTGFSLIDLGSISDVSKALLFLGMLIGGATFSTAGGIKVFRFVVAVKNLGWSAARMATRIPLSVRRSVGTESISDEVLMSVLGFIALYVFTDLSLAILFSAVAKTSFINALFEITSALGCVGLSVGIVSHTLNLAGKFVIIAAMYLGRLEFIQFYLILAYLFRKKVKVIA